MNYWWINANPHDDKILWSWTNNVCVGEMKEWYSQNKTGKERKFFSKVKVGDLVLGYNTGTQREIVALGEISAERYTNKDGVQVIGITKTKDIKYHISIEEVKQIEALKDIFCKSTSLRGTIFSLTKEEYEELTKLIV